MDASSDDEELPVAVSLAADEETLNPYPGGGVSEQAPVPVTLITGYLGAGKTTLVRYILNERHGYRIAVILNEYGGETGLESAFVQDEQGDRANVPQWVELANGCLCCSVKAEFVQALEGLLSTGSQHAGKFDYVLVETTGLANPGPIMSELWTDEELEAAVVLDGVVAVVDGKHVAQQLAETRPGGGANEAQLQVALADVILLNKTDLLSEAQAAAVQAQLRTINSAATIIPTAHSRVDLGHLLNRGAYRLRLLDHINPKPQGSDDAKTAKASAGDGSSDAPEAAAAAAADVQRPLQWLQDVAAAAAAAAAAGPHSAGPPLQCSDPGCSNPDHHHYQHQHHQHDYHCDGQQQAGDQARERMLSGQQGLSGLCQAHDVAVRTVSLRVARPLLLDKFREWVEQLIWEHPAAAKEHTPAAAAAAAAGGDQLQQDTPTAAAAVAAAVGQGPEVLRMKGLLNVAGSDQVHMFQAVYDLYDIVPGSSWQQLQQHMVSKAAAAAAGPRDGPPGAQGSSSSSSNGGMKLTRLVLIGRYLDQQQLQQQLECCCSYDAADADVEG